MLCCFVALVVCVGHDEPLLVFDVVRFIVVCLTSDVFVHQHVDAFMVLRNEAL